MPVTVEPRVIARLKDRLIGELDGKIYQAKLTRVGHDQLQAKTEVQGDVITKTTSYGRMVISSGRLRKDACLRQWTPGVVERLMNSKKPDGLPYTEAEAAAAAAVIVAKMWEDEKTNLVPQKLFRDAYDQHLNPIQVEVLVTVQGEWEEV